MKLLFLAGFLQICIAQTQTGLPPAQAQQAPVNPNSAEMNTREDTAASFKSHVNLVPVTVVVRDLHGAAVGNLTKENFQLFDKGKLQEISRFSVEKLGSKAPLDATGSPVAPSSPTQGDASAIVPPERFVAYLFDDVHLSPGDLSRVREAAQRHLADLQPTDRAAIFTISGTLMVDFTDNKDRLNGGLLSLRPGIMTRVGALTGGDTLTLQSLAAIKETVRRLSIAPGQRTMMVISPGFFTIDPMFFPDKNEILDRAVRANVIISALDARGLYTDPSFDVQRTRPPSSNALMRESMRADILAEMASGTGGSFFQNSNNYDEGFKRVAAAPEYLYVLTFAPQNLKNDGSFHALRVTVKPSNNVTVQARHGYYAPKRLDDPEETARQEIEAALFSREEMHDLPIDLQTQFFKTGDLQAKLTVLARLDLKQFKYRKVEGRNNNVVTVVSALFDRNGRYLQSIKKVLELRLKDDTLANRLGSGATLRSTFDVAPGPYIVRLVVRDAEGQLMSATNGTATIPY